MKIVFIVIAIIGLLSFFGALKNGDFFFIGLVLAAVFGYFGWRPQKKNSDRNINNSNIQVKPVNFGQNSENTEEKLKNINQKIELLNSSFSKGLLNQNEFRKKLTKLEIEKEQLL
jgi:predicted negative regulator of RcsB-dependent stress response